MTATPPATGTAAPDFTLETTAGPMTLSQFRGKQHVLLAFFPLAFTSVCTAEMCSFTEDYSAFASKEVAVLPISVDSVPTLKEFKAKHGMTVELASDFKREVSRLYGTLHLERFFSNRAYFLIDKAGVLRWSFVETTPGTRRENAELLAEIAKLGA
ncbi:MAG: redoxin domain-containing protein [Gemmatimonadaceae bacterium]|nr:redoxin domain-containing protein [Gemmatimonadaceae bacterium]